MAKRKLVQAVVRFLSRISNLLDVMSLAPSGYFMAIRVGFGFPQAEYNRFPEAWIAEYTREGLLIDDPVMRWAYRNEGAIRWSALHATDRAGIMTRAARHGLRFGVSVSCCDADSAYRSFGSFARDDREFDDDEAAVLGALVANLHESSRPTGRLTPAEREALGLVRDGRLLKEIAAELGISQNAVKQRLKNARVKLNARNGSHAVSLAVKSGLI